MNKLLFDNRFKHRFFRHLIFFATMVLLFAGILFIQNGTDSFFHTLWITFINSMFFFGYAYITIFLLIPEFLLTRKLLWFVLLFLLVGIGLSTLKLIVSDQIFYSSISPENIERTGIMNLRFIAVNTKDMTFIVALFCIAKYAKDYLYVENLRKKLEIQNREAQAKLIQSQLHPHFLFNTINNLYALSLLHPQKTLEVTDRIKTVLKYIIDESQRDFVLLKEEVVLVENYILLEKLRYGKRLKVEFRKEGDLEHAKIPPMILFFLVENCFKHGSSSDSGSPWIKISVQTESGKTTLSTQNSTPAKENPVTAEKKFNGTGLVNLRKRLDFIYAHGGYSLTISEEKDMFSVNLTLNQEGIEIGRKKYR